MTKRLFDIVGSVALLVVLSPVLLLTAIAIRLTSPGPVLFRQTRVGRDGAPFRILKFRTMVADAERIGPVITTAGDPRITRVGAWLRRTKLDELPQLFNVLRGDMSFVGPRPEVPKYVDLYTPAQREVLRLRPGITGISQIEMRDEEAMLEGVGDIENAYIRRIMPAKLRLDLEYVRRHNLGDDLWLLVRTVFRLSDIPRERRAPEPGAVSRLFVRHRRLSIVVGQLAVVGWSNYLAFVLRFDFSPTPADLGLFWQALPWLVVIRGLVFVPFRLHEGLWRYTSIYDLRMLLGGVFTSSVVFALFVMSPLGPDGYPRSVVVIDAILLVMLLGGLRLMRRMVTEAALAGEGTGRLLIIGAGGAGEMLVRELSQAPAFGLRPIGFVDDDPRKTGARIRGVRVLGTIDAMPAIVRRHDPSAFLIALPNAAPERIRAIVETLEPFHLPIKVLPKFMDVIEQGSTVGQIRPLALEDLLPRPAVAMDAGTMQKLIYRRRVMVTGAGGTIGSELCRQILKFRPTTLVLFERHEHGLLQIRQDLERAGGAAGSRVVPILGDVTDEAAVHATMARVQPEVIVHTAAHKHGPLMDANPCEAVRNNIRGTRVLAAAADSWGVDRFVLISTSKAADLSCVTGMSKLLAEQLVLLQAGGSGTSFSIVRFGSVLGGSDSVVPQFLEQVAGGGPVTITHPDARRHFTFTSEAVSLGLVAAAQAQNGGTYVLEPGEPVRLVDLARNVIRQAGQIPGVDIPITFTGLLPGEPLIEPLVSDLERMDATSVPGVFKVTRPALPSDLADRVRMLEEQAALGRVDLVLEGLRHLGMTGRLVVTREPVPAVPVAVAQADQFRVPCPACAQGAIVRSRVRNVIERWRKDATGQRPYRCAECGWRGWLASLSRTPRSGDRPASAMVPPDLSALDAGVPATHDGSTPNRAFSPRDL